jgi:hypothetical protein
MMKKLCARDARYGVLCAVVIVATSAAAIADELPIVFTRSGQKATIAIGDKATSTAVVVTAFGQSWGKPIAAKDNAVEFTAPPVRVPVVFQLVAASDMKTALGEIVVYPDRPAVQWDKDVQLALVGESEWLLTWAEAVGLPIKCYKSPESFDAEREVSEKSYTLLIVGRKAAEKDPIALCRFAAARKTNVLALEADWFGKIDAPRKGVRVFPIQMRGDLKQMSLQTWPMALDFAARRQPWPGVINRWVWIADAEQIPLVERFGVVELPLDAMRPVVASYLPWREQLGRREVADATFVAMLAAAAKTSFPHEWRTPAFIYPKQEQLSRRTRPILFAAAHERISWEVPPSSTYVFDVRGNQRPPQEAIEELQSLKDRIKPGSDNLLILGDDASLDGCEWLKLDRQNKTAGWPGVAWLADKELPSKNDNQIRIMSTLTELGVPLAVAGPPGNEENER